MRTEKEIIEKLKELPDHNWDTPMEALQWVLDGESPHISLRDFLAANAPPIEISEHIFAKERPEWLPYMRGDAYEEHLHGVKYLKWAAKRDALYRYIWADAMLKESKKV